MLNPVFKKTLLIHFNRMQEFAFTNPILKAQDIDGAIQTGKFTKRFPYTNQWWVSVCLTISPELNNQNHFWHSSLAYVSKLSGKPKSRLLWTVREVKNAKEVLSLVLQDVGLVEDYEPLNPITFKGHQIAQHGYKHLSDVERIEIFEGNN